MRRQQAAGLPVSRQAARGKPEGEAAKRRRREQVQERATGVVRELSRRRRMDAFFLRQLKRDQTIADPEAHLAENRDKWFALGWGWFEEIRCPAGPA